jgi:hypothetical protein
MLLASPTDIRLGWFGLPGANTLAYYENSQLTAGECFLTLGPAFIRRFEQSISVDEVTKTVGDVSHD